MTDKQTAALRRLIAIDAALSSRDGAHVGDLAERFGVDPKTIRREFALLRDLVGPTEDRMVAADNVPGRSWRHYYLDRRRQLFARWLSPE